MAKRVAVEPPQLAPPAKLLLDVRGAAQALSCSVWSVRWLLANRKIPKIKIGRKHLIDPEDLRLFIRDEKAVA